MHKTVIVKKAYITMLGNSKTDFRTVASKNGLIKYYILSSTIYSYINNSYCSMM